MSKRSRALYEADLQAQQSPFVAFGTPLPPLDPDIRDDGSYVPVWKQDVRDEQGRRRLHGAFTGGWSAGYYNTVGSKEGWTPSAFVSSRTSRRKDNPDATQHRPEDYMDEEDLADAEESRKIQTSQSFAGLGLTKDDSSRPATSGGALAGLFKVSGETMGTKLLKKMGWKEGQGIGPKVRRTARLDVGKPEDRKMTYLFAPENIVLVHLVKKTDRKGLGFGGAARLASIAAASRDDGTERADSFDNDDSDENGDDAAGIRSGLFGRPKLLAGKTKTKTTRGGGIGLGVLNDTGSDDDDPYDMGPRISFNRVIGGDKKKKKAKPKPVDSIGEGGSGDSGSGTKPRLVFSTKQPMSLGKRPSGARLCHDGRAPLQGFVLGRKSDPLTADVNASARFPLPVIPHGWKSSKQPRGGTTTTQQADGSYVSTADAARASKLDPKSRAAVLGESQLPGKSVFDFMSQEARDRIAVATGRKDLPEARGEVPAAYALTEQEKLDQLLQAVPSLDKASAVAAITRGARGGGPYQDNETKRARYRAYLEYQAGIASALPPKPTGVKDDDWLREFYEFFNCARIFKPMSGPMASRFTTSTSTNQPLTGGPGSKMDDEANLVTRPAPKPQDPAEEAAKMGMYGPMTRTVQDFFPTRLLCKRMGVKPPPIVQPDAETDVGQFGASPWSSSAPNKPTFGSAAFGGYSTAGTSPAHTEPKPSNVTAETPGRQEPVAPKTQPQSGAGAAVAVRTDRNEALEGQRAGEDVFRAVFGDSDSDDDGDS